MAREAEPGTKRETAHADAASEPGSSSTHYAETPGTAGSWMSSLRKKLFQQESEKTEQPPDMPKVECVIDATAKRLEALELIMYGYKSDIQHHQRVQQGAALRLSKLEGMLMDAEDTLTTQIGRSRQLNVEVGQVERKLGPEAIKRGRERRMVEGPPSPQKVPFTKGPNGKPSWEARLLSKLPL